MQIQGLTILSSCKIAQGYAEVEQLVPLAYSMRIPFESETLVSSLSMSQHFRLSVAETVWRDLRLT